LNAPFPETAKTNDAVILDSLSWHLWDDHHRNRSNLEVHIEVKYRVQPGARNEMPALCKSSSAASRTSSSRWAHWRQLKRASDYRVVTLDILRNLFVVRSQEC
jgi:hypothetical protein